MNMMKGKETVESLKNGAVIYTAQSIKSERRLYRYNNIEKVIEYTDDNVNWKNSKMKLEDFELEYWMIERSM